MGSKLIQNSALLDSRPTTIRCTQLRIPRTRTTGEEASSARADREGPSAFLAQGELGSSREFHFLDLPELALQT